MKANKLTNAQMVKGYHDRYVGMGEALLAYYDQRCYAMWALEEKIAVAKTQKAKSRLRALYCGIRRYEESYC